MFFVHHVFMLVGVVWLPLCALSQKLCGRNVIQAVNGFLLIDTRPEGVIDVFNSLFLRLQMDFITQMVATLYSFF